MRILGSSPTNLYYQEAKNQQWILIVLYNQYCVSNPVKPVVRYSGIKRRTGVDAAGPVERWFADKFTA